MLDRRPAGRRWLSHKKIAAPEGRDDVNYC